MSLDDQIDQLHREISAAPLGTDDAVEAFRVQMLGRKAGAVTALFGEMRNAPAESRRELGQRLNALRAAAEERLALAQEALAASTAGGAATDLDLTLPGRPPAAAGSIHPLRQTLRAAERISHGMGFETATGPEIEADWYNFTALHFGPEHPARDMQDTFWIERPREGATPGADDPTAGGVVLRTHTSPVQVRVMEHQAPPLRVIAPGRVYRNEALSYKSFCLFHQIEGLVVDEGVTFADLKETLRQFVNALFGREATMRFRPSFFPFTEPSAEVDVWWEDESLPGGGRWMEILGCGMVDPAVLENVGIDSERYTGYAFGMGVERLAMLRHGVADIRLFYQNDVRFLAQF